MIPVAIVMASSAIGLDIVAIVEERWLLVAVICAVLAGYLFSMNFKRFLAIVMMSIVFQLMWETMSLGIRFPYFSLYYVYHPEIDYYILTVPLSAILFKSIVYSTGSYMMASAAGRKYVNGKIDMVTDRGKRIVEHIIVGLFGAAILSLSYFIIEPLLASGSYWFLGSYEYFTRPGYFGVDYMYFVGVAVASSANFSVMSILEARIEGPRGREKPLFDFEGEEQSMRGRHKYAFIAFSMSLLLPAFISLLMNVSLGLSSFLVFIPAVYAMFGLTSWWSSRMDRGLVSKFCKKNPGSFVCRE